MLVESWLLRAARRRPGHDALPGVPWATLLARADAVAGELRGADVRTGDPVGLALPPGPDAVVALHAVLRAGAHAVPVDPRLPAGERERRTAGCALVLGDLPPDRGTRARPPGGPLADRHDTDATAVVVHTSGTSGPATPVSLTFGNWLWSALGSAAALGCPRRERWLAALPLTHVGGLSIVLRAAISATTAVVHPGWDTDRVLAALRGPEGPTAVSLVPTTLRRLLDAGLERPPVLRVALLGGAPVPEGLLEEAAARGVPVVPTYGLTETCSQVLTGGRPLFCTRVRLDDPDGLVAPGARARPPGATRDDGVVDDVAAGAVGEILVAGPTVAPSAAGPDGWLRTGDLGRRAGGGLAVVGRRAETIVTGGENVLPGEVEAVLGVHPDVVEAGVHGVPDPTWGEAVHAALVLRRGAVDPESVLRWARPQLAPHQRPKAARAWDALPRTPSGKLLRRVLADGPPPTAAADGPPGADGPLAADGPPAAAVPDDDGDAARSVRRERRAGAEPSCGEGRGHPAA